MQTTQEAPVQRTIAFYFSTTTCHFVFIVKWSVNPLAVKYKYNNVTMFRYIQMTAICFFCILIAMDPLVVLKHCLN